jgi:hypothetical protein
VLERRAQLPHFAVTTIDGTRFTYADVWQSMNLVLVVLPPSVVQADASYAAALTSALELSNPTGQHTALVVTRDRIANEEHPLALIADKWGEIQYLTRAVDAAGLPDTRELGEWLTYIRIRCCG